MIDIVLAFCGGVAIVFGPGLCFKRFKESIGLERYFYVIAAIFFLVVGFILLIKSLFFGIVALLLSLFVFVLMFPPKDDRPLLGDSVDPDLAAKIEEISKETKSSSISPD